MRNFLKTGIFIFMISCIFVLFGKTDTAYAAFNIVLDPGHDATHAGASGNGVKEEVINYKIAKYCYEELQKYTGYDNVYMTRNSEACPYPGTSSTECNKKRVDFSKSVGANVYVSIHNNSSSSSAAKGASVFYPNNNFNAAIGKQGERLANVMLNKLIELGLENRGTHIRNSEDNTRYADGSLADYYGVIKNSKLAGFTAVIIEHAFISNSSDVSNYLSSDAKLKLLGIADAVAIADYYGLKKIEYWDKNVSQAKMSTSFSANGTKIKAVVSGISKAPAVKLAVWCGTDNSNLKWYTAKKNNDGNWYYEIPISDFKKNGNYNIHAYAVDGGDIFACAGAIKVEAPSVGKMTAKDVDYTKGVFYVDLENVTANSEINKVNVAVWTESNQSDLRWLEAKKVSGGKYRLTVNITEFTNSNKVFNIHAYAEDKTGISGFLNSINYKVEFAQGVVTAVLDKDDNYYQITANNIAYSPMVTSVKAALWSEENGQDDVVWYTMSKTDDGWKYNGNASSHITSSKVNVHVYAYLRNGTSLYVGGTSYVPNKSNKINEISSVITGESVLLWDGEKISAAVNYSDISVTKKVIEVSGEATENVVKVTEDAGEATESIVKVTEDAAIVTEGTVNVTDISNEAIKLREKIYSMKDSTALYLAVKNLLKGGDKGGYQTFFAAGAELFVDNALYTYNINGQVKLRFDLPQSFNGKEIKIYELNNTDGVYTLGKVYNVTSSALSYAEIYTDRLGDYIIATDFIENNKLIGDLNFDKVINLNDAKILLRGALGISVLTNNQKEVADINYDSKINLTDAKMLLKKALGIA